VVVVARSDESDFRREKKPEERLGEARWAVLVVVAMSGGGVSLLEPKRGILTTCYLINAVEDGEASISWVPCVKGIACFLEGL
jgi:hypothetical protein